MIFKPYFCYLNMSFGYFCQHCVIASVCMISAPVTSIRISWTYPELLVWIRMFQEGCESPVIDLQTKHKDQILFEELFSVWVNVYIYFSIVTVMPSDIPTPQIGVTVALLTTIVGVISVNQTWDQEWDIIPISLQVSRKGTKPWVDCFFKVDL